MIKGPIKIVIIGPPASGKTQLAQAIAEFIDDANGLSGPGVAIYDGDHIAIPNSAAEIHIMTVQCTADQFDDPAELLRGYQARAGKI